MSEASQSLYPLTFQPVLKSYPWGGRKLATHLGRELPPGKVAESWEISAHPNGPTRVAHGPAANRTLAELFAEWGEALVGSRNAAALERGRFPILIKLLDAAEWLSVQVHPDDAYALEHENDLGKTEMWVVLDAEPGAELILGFRPDVEPELFAQAVATGRADDWLHRVPVETGDVFFLLPGTIHAIGPGILLTEIQQSSDITYRVYDWNRGADDRPLHLSHALEVLDFGATEPGAVWTSSEDGENGDQLLASCAYFETQRLRLSPGATVEGRCDGSTFEAWAVLEGTTRLEWDGDPLDLDAVQWLLLPAAMGEYRFTARGEATLLRVRTPALDTSQTDSSPVPSRMR